MAVGSTRSDGSPFTAEDEGKRVVTADGAVVGNVSRVEGGTALIAPAADVLDGLGPCLYDAWTKCAPFELDSRAVATIDSEAVVLKSARPAHPFPRE